MLHIISMEKKYLFILISIKSSDKSFETVFLLLHAFHFNKVPEMKTKAWHFLLTFIYNEKHLAPHNRILLPLIVQFMALGWFYFDLTFLHPMGIEIAEKNNTKDRDLRSDWTKPHSGSFRNYVTLSIRKFSKKKASFKLFN